MTPVQLSLLFLSMSIFRSTCYQGTRRWDLSFIKHSTRIFHSANLESAPSVDDHFMKLALRHAQHAYREKEVPIGAVIVSEEGTVIAASRNKVEQSLDVTAHAEVDCIRKAAKVVNNWRLNGCTIYTTLEPCPICMGAMQAARVKKVVYAATDNRLGVCGSWMDMTTAVHPFHRIEVVGGVLADESATLLKRFFYHTRKRGDPSSMEGLRGELDVS